jgi:hypothetical protein
MITVALLLALQTPSHVEAPPGDVGEVRRDFRGTEWVVERGCHTRAKVWEGRVVFTDDNQVLVVIGYRFTNATYKGYYVSAYEHDPGTDLPAIPPRKRPGLAMPKRDGTFRQHGNRLLLELDLTESETMPKGRLLLLMKQVK